MAIASGDRDQNFKGGSQEGDGDFHFDDSVTEEAVDSCGNKDARLVSSSTDHSKLVASVGWDPRQDHPCTIERLTMIEFENQYGPQGGLPPLYPRPIVITTSTTDDDDASSAYHNRNQQFREMTKADTILQNFPVNFTVTLSSSNSFSEHRRTIPFSQHLLDETLARKEISPDQRSNETWYLFGETYSNEWKQLLQQQYTLPPCQACQHDKHDSLVALSFGIGNVGSGVSWHVHGPGFSEAVHGRKHWVLQETEPEFHPDQTSYNWMYYNYSVMKESERPMECTLHPGDMVYFPNMWWHATINLDEYTAFISTFTQEHLFVATT